MKKTFLLKISKMALAIMFMFTATSVVAQTNVYDDVIATSSNHTYLKAAIDQQGLASALQNANSTFTVFAPENAAFDSLASKLGTDIAGILALPNLTDVLLHHVLGIEVSSTGVTNGALVTPLDSSNTIKMTKTSNGMVYANQAMVTTADLSTDNGTVHSIDAVLLSSETVVDVALDNGFSTLATAVITAELLPALTDPFATFTVFAPTNDAFDSLASNLNTDVNGLLALSNLADVLTYHVLGSEVPASGVTNGAVVSPLSATNTLKLTVTSDNKVYVNQAEVTATDITADNGIVHVLNAVVLPSETVVDIALDNGFSTLATAVITAELLPALTDPFATFTVFAPTNDAFDSLAVKLNTDLNGILALDNLADILLYHVVDGKVNSSSLTNGSVVTLNGASIQVDITNGVMINTSNVTLADVDADNGIVHVIDQVLIPNSASVKESKIANLSVYPNPAFNSVTVNSPESIITSIRILNSQGMEMMNIPASSFTTTLDISSLSAGVYLLDITSDNKKANKLFVISGK